MARTAKEAISGTLRKRTTKKESFDPIVPMSPGMGDLQKQSNSLLTPIASKIAPIPKMKRQKKVKKTPKHFGDTFDMEM